MTQDAFGRALARLRERQRSGRFVQGEQLMVSALSREFGLGATPIREALSRLAGEGLIEERRGAGYFAWRIDAVDLVELYELQRLFWRSVRASPEPEPPASASDASGPADLVQRVEALFARRIAAGRSLAVQRANRLLADRLAPARRAEPQVLEGVEAELSALAQADAASADPLLETYHARRVTGAAAIVQALRNRVDVL